MDTFTVTNSNIDNIFLSPDGSRLYASDRYTQAADIFIFNTANDSLLSKVRIASAPDLYGDFVSTLPIDSIEGGFVATNPNTPSINNQFFTQFKNANGQLYGELTSNNNLGSISWGAKINAQTSLQTAFGWFGGTQKQDGAYMNRNLFITPTNQPTSATTVRIYFTNFELKNFIDSFNHRYNTALTEKDIRILKYDGSNVDLDRTNNVDNGAVYTSIAPSKIGYYGFTNTYRYIEFPVSSFSEFYITLAVPNGVLPVSLTKFAAENKGKDVQLSWQTGIGQNISLFDVEKSADGFAFKKMIFVSGNNNPGTMQNYSAVDNSPVYPKTFYRLRIVEKDGSYSYSNVLGVNFGSDKSITIYPNPASKTLTIQLTSAIQKGNQIRILDVTGKVVKIVPIANDNAMTVTVNISSLVKGLYTIVIGDVHKTFIKGE